MRRARPRLERILGRSEAEIKGSDVVVVGGGLIGLAVAREAAVLGARVTLLERAVPAREASWAAAGMLSPQGEASGPGPFLRLALASAALYGEFAAALEEASGIDPGLRRLDKVLVALDAEGADALSAREAWQRDEGLRVRPLTAEALHAEVPGLASGAIAGLAIVGDGMVDPRRLGESARRAAEASGVRILTGVRVRGVGVHKARVRAVHLAGGGRLGADSVVAAAGPWSGRLEGLPRPLPVRPVRGQMIALRVPAPWPPAILAGAGVYLLPREADDGPRVWVGATMEEAGFRRRTTDAGRQALHAAAARLAPALADAPVAEHWAGLRPGTPDGLPILGADPEVAGLVYATGHFRNGILLAPITARLLGRVLAGERPDELEPFRPDRFASDIA